MKNGTVNVRTREDGKLGEVRVDKFADQLKEELPKSSESENKLYAKVWKAENYGLEPVSGSKQPV